MGSRDLLAGFLWRARAGMRVEGLPLRGGHGMADAAYRPPFLPYASVVGPLTIELEPEREPPHAVFLPVQAPGYLAGVDRAAADTVPPPGTVTLRFDGDTTVAAAVDTGGLTGQSLIAPGVGAEAARRLEEALRAGQPQVAGIPVTDPERLAELATVTARWDADRRRVVIASGRRGPITGTDLLARQPSSVELEAPVTALATALGLDGQAAVRAPGRIVRHRRPTPTAVAVDVRLDLWTGSQSELATVVDAWTRTTATRGQLLVRPAVLAADVAPQDTSVRLLAPAEPTVRSTIALLDVVDATVLDRPSGRAARVSTGASVAGGEVTLNGAERVVLDFFEPPPVPVAWAPESPTTHGYGATVGLRVPARAAGIALRVLTVTGQGRTALGVDVEFVAEGAGTAAELRASAMRADAGDFVAASTRVATARLAAGIDLHVSLDSRRGGLALAVDGEPVAEATGAAGTPVGGQGMRLTLGPPDGTHPNAGAVVVRYVHLHGVPVGPPDPRLRLGAAPAGAWSPGEPLLLARSTDGVTASGTPVAASVVGVRGDTLLLDRPVQSSFPRATSVAFLRSEFFSQRSLRRSDDLMNQLYRMCAEYRVSTVLDEPDAGVSAPLVETTDVRVRDFGRLAAELANPGQPALLDRPAARVPGTTAVFTTNPPRSGVPSPTTTAEPPDSTEESHG